MNHNQMLFSQHDASKATHSLLELNKSWSSLREKIVQTPTEVRRVSDTDSATSSRLANRKLHDDLEEEIPRPLSPPRFEIATKTAAAISALSAGAKNITPLVHVHDVHLPKLNLKGLGSNLSLLATARHHRHQPTNTLASENNDQSEVCNIYASDVESSLERIVANKSIVRLEFEDVVIDNDCRTIISKISDLILSWDRSWQAIIFVDHVAPEDFILWRGHKRHIMESLADCLDMSHGLSKEQITFRAVIEVRPGTCIKSFTDTLRHIKHHPLIINMKLSGTLHGCDKSNIGRRLENCVDENGSLTRRIKIELSCGWVEHPERSELVEICLQKAKSLAHSRSLLDGSSQHSHKTGERLNRSRRHLLPLEPNSVHVRKRQIQSERGAAALPPTGEKARLRRGQQRRQVQSERGTVVSEQSDSTRQRQHKREAKSERDTAQHESHPQTVTSRVRKERRPLSAPGQAKKSVIHHDSTVHHHATAKDRRTNRRAKMIASSPSSVRELYGSQSRLAASEEHDSLPSIPSLTSEMQNNDQRGPDITTAPDELDASLSLLDLAAEVASTDEALIADREIPEAQRPKLGRCPRRNAVDMTMSCPEQALTRSRSARRGALIDEALDVEVKDRLKTLRQRSRSPDRSYKSNQY